MKKYVGLLVYKTVPLITKAEIHKDPKLKLNVKGNCLSKPLK